MHRVNEKYPELDSRKINMYPVTVVLTKLKEQDKFWIAFTGDSITSCEWVHPNWRDIVIYVLHNEITHLLHGDWKTAEWGIRGFNFAYDGATTKDILERVNDINVVKPDLVISLMGGNDPAVKMSVGETVESIKGLKDKLTGQVVWCTSTPAGYGSSKNSEYEPYAVATMQIPETENFKLLDMFHFYKQFPLEKFFTFKSEENPVEGLKKGDPDLQHPNQLGNAYIAKVILKEVFRIEFNPDKHIAETLAGEKFPGY